MTDVIVNDPTLAAFYEPHMMVAYEQTLTPDGEIKLIRVERPAVHEEAPLQVELITDEGHDG